MLYILWLTVTHVTFTCGILFGNVLEVVAYLFNIIVMLTKFYTILGSAFFLQHFKIKPILQYSTLYFWLRPSTDSYLCEGEGPAPRSTPCAGYRPQGCL